MLQLETAMGAAIECFKGAGAVAVPRTRFAPVKKCNDLMLLRSDAYVVNEHFNIVLAPERSVFCSCRTSSLCDRIFYDLFFSSVDLNLFCFVGWCFLF